LDKDFNFDSTKINDSFLEKISLALIAFENDAKPLYTIIYSLELEDAEKIISKIPLIYSTFIKELAEQYVLGYKNSLIDKLIENKNETFLKEASFLKTMKAAITKSGRKQLKKNLLQSYERLVFELDEKTLEAVAKKKSREDLKSKFKQWDEELVEVETEEYSFAREPINLYKNQESKYSSNSKRKSISLSWIKYAAAACIILTAGIMYFKFNTDNNFVQPSDSNVVTAPVKKDTNSKGTITSEIPIETIADISSVSKTTPVIESGLGFASKEKKIKITENNQRARMQSIVIAIDKYRQFLEKELTENKVGYGPVVKEIESKIRALKNELDLLKERDNHYIFDGKSLILYSSNFAKENAIVVYEDKYYLKRDADFYSLTIAKQQQAYKKVTDTTLVEVLYNLYFE
jgi:hypothetical protein